jgi:hypothetical protein
MQFQILQVNRGFYFPIQIKLQVMANYNIIDFSLRKEAVLLLHVDPMVTLLQHAHGTLKILQNLKI